MQIRVKSLQGGEYVVQVAKDQLVSQLKAVIKEKSDGQLPIDRQKLVYKGRTMQDSSSIGEYNLEEDCKIHLILQKETNSTANHTTSSHSVGATNNEYDKRCPKRTSASRFETLLKERLTQHNHFTPDEIERIMAVLHHEIDSAVNSSSLDDLERLAEQKLKISNE